MSALSVSLCSLVLAFCGLTYQLTIAQSLSVLIGNSVVQYSLTIGLFLVSMGYGAMRSPTLGDARQYLFRLQIALCGFAPLGLIGVWVLGIHASKLFLYISAVILIAGLGWLTGKELPLLLRLAGPGLRLKVLGFDHFGMLLACLSFPLVLLPSVGLLASVFLISALNACAALLLAQTVRHRLTAGAAASALLTALLFEPLLREWLSQRFLA